MSKWASCGIIPVRKGVNGAWEFLVLQQTNGVSWTFPKGTSEEGETPLQTALREAGEEAGLSSEAFSIFEQYTFEEEYDSQELGNPIEKTVTYFLALVEGDPQITIQESEILEYRWVSYKEARELFIYPSRQTVLDEVHATLLTLDI